MPLTMTDVKPIRSTLIFGWAIQTQDENGKTVQVLITDDALQLLTSPPAYNIERVRMCRPQIESIASAKQAAKLLQPDGTVLITTNDVKDLG